MSRLTLIVVSLAVGIALAVGAAFATSGLISSPPPSPTKAQVLYNYGTR